MPSADAARKLYERAVQKLAQELSEPSADPRKQRPAQKDRFEGADDGIRAIEERVKQLRRHRFWATFRRLG